MILSLLVLVPPSKLLLLLPLLPLPLHYLALKTRPSITLAPPQIRRIDQTHYLAAVNSHCGRHCRKGRKQLRR
uniref:Putative secreted peptide n=1 Tax=Anopheles braziliensis TaxID=58242 RepID=A0A2M3ZMX9_9DIPT